MKILFIADKFDDEPRDKLSPFPGGAELTDSALIESSPYLVDKVKFSELNVKELKNYDIHIIGNSKTASSMQFEKLLELKRFVLFEHDMRICRYDGDYLRAKKEPVHFFLHRCICPHLKLRSLYTTALSTVFLTRKQYEIYKGNPFFRVKNAFILGSSAMNINFFKRVDSISRRKTDLSKKKGTAIFYSPHRAKGYQKSLKFCIDHNYDINMIRNVKPEEVLDIFERSERFVYLPESTEWAGRMVIEARFLGCELVLNKNVGVAGEDWWDLPDKDALKVLKQIPKKFWNNIEKIMEKS